MIRVVTGEIYIIKQLEKRSRNVKVGKHKINCAQNNCSPSKAITCAQMKSSLYNTYYRER